MIRPVVLASARKHGVTDDDILHAVNNPVRFEPLDEGLTMLVGADRAGNLLEGGVVDGTDGSGHRACDAGANEVPEGGVSTMPRTVREILEQAEDLAARFEQHEPVDDSIDDAAPLRAVRAAFLARARAEEELADAVRIAREKGCSWASIGAMVGTSGEAARQRYGTMAAKAR